jgi:hypothetical protein
MRLHRWRHEADQAGRQINRIIVAYEAGREGFWLPRWLRARDVATYALGNTRHFGEPADICRCVTVSAVITMRHPSEQPL